MSQLPKMSSTNYNRSSIASFEDYKRVHEQEGMVVDDSSFSTRSSSEFSRNYSTQSNSSLPFMNRPAHRVHKTSFSFKTK